MSEDTNERDKKIERVNHVTPSPSRRADYVWNILSLEHPELTDWDITCFAAEYLGLQSVGNLTWLQEPAKEICRLVHTAHYLATESTDVSTGIP